MGTVILPPEEVRKELREAAREAFAPAAELAKLQNRLSVTAVEAAQLLGVSPDTLRNWRVQKRGPEYSKIGTKVVYEVPKLRKWLEANVRKTIAC